MYIGAIVLLSFLLVDAQIFQESIQPEAGYCDLKPLINGEINYNGNNTVTSVAVGETVDVRCFEGFRLSTIRTQLVQLTCQANGSWTDSLHTVAFPVCEKMGGCSVPTLAHGRVILKTDGTSFMPGEITFVLCNLGYKIAELGFTVGFLSITCQHNGHWKNSVNSSTMTCEEMKCGRPVLIRNGSFKFSSLLEQTVSDGYSVGTKLYYSCDTGYVLRGSNLVVTCENGLWSGAEQLECVAKGSVICSHPPHIVNGYYTVSFKNDDVYGTKYSEQFGAGTAVYYSCNLGYKMSGVAAKTCVDGQWLPSAPPSACIPVAKGCTQPPKIRFGNYTLDPSYSINQYKLPENAVAYYSCMTGYRIAPEGSIAQLLCRDTRWQGNNFTCERRVGCDKPMDIPDGNWFIDDVYPDHRVGSRVSYECNDGYRISGSSSIVCDFSGYWSDNAPKCLRKDQFCSDPGSITNGFYVCKPNNCDNFREGTEVHFMCSTGYVIEPAELAVQTCESGGYWTGSALALYCSPEFVTTTVGSAMYVPEPSTLVVLVVTICGIIGLLLLVIVIVAVQRHMKRRVPVPFCSDPPPFLPSVAAQPMRREHDRVALIAFPDVDSSAILPTYEEALRTRPPGQRIARFGNELVHSSSIRSIRSDYRPLPHVGVSSISRVGTPAVQMREQHTSQEQRADHRRNSIVTNSSMMTRDNMSLAFGSVETVNVSDATSTTVTISTFESGGSNPSLATSVSQRATAGSVASASTPTEEDVPLLDGSSTLGYACRQQMEAEPIPEEEHQE